MILAPVYSYMSAAFKTFHRSRRNLLPGFRELRERGDGVSTTNGSRWVHLQIAR